jgi:hypothetical protein
VLALLVGLELDLTAARAGAAAHGSDDPRPHPDVGLLAELHVRRRPASAPPPEELGPDGNLVRHALVDLEDA